MNKENEIKKYIYSLVVKIDENPSSELKNNSIILFNKYKNDSRDIKIIKEEIDKTFNNYLIKTNSSNIEFDNLKLNKGDNSFIYYLNSEGKRIMDGAHFDTIYKNKKTSKSSVVMINDSFKGIMKDTSKNISKSLDDFEMVINYLGTICNINIPRVFRLLDRYKNCKGIIRASVIQRNEEVFILLNDLKLKIQTEYSNGINHYYEWMRNIEVLNNNKLITSLKLPEATDIEKVLLLPIDIVNSIKDITIEDKNNFRKDYFNMIIFDLFINEKIRNLNNYGVVYNEENNTYSFSAIYDGNNVISSSINDDQYVLNNCVCNKNDLLELLFNDYYDDIKDKLENIINSYNNKHDEIMNVIYSEAHEQNGDIYINLLDRNIAILENLRKPLNIVVEKKLDIKGYIYIINLFLIVGIIIGMGIGLASILLK